MTPEDIELPGAPKKKAAPAQEAPAKIVRPPEPITESELYALRELPTTRVDGMEVLGEYNKFPDLRDIPVRFCCHCKRWDLSKEADRAEYGDLSARALSNGSPVEIAWEERCKEDSGLIIYLTFFEYVRVAEVHDAKSC